MTEMIKCWLLRRGNESLWVKYKELVYLKLDNDEGGIALRSVSTNTLVLDIPASTIQIAQVISKTSIRIETIGSNQIALEFETSESLNLLLSLYEANQIAVQTDISASDSFQHFAKQIGEDGLPDIKDPSDTFDDFVNDIEQWLDKTKAHLP